MRPFATLLLAACLSAPALARDRPPPDLLTSNMAELPYTAHVRIDRASVARTTSDDRGHAGYVTFRLDVTVLESFRGAAHDAIVLFQTAEAPAQPPATGKEIVVSFKLAGDGRFVVPDNGYVFPADRAVLERARSLARRTPKLKH